MGKVEVIREGGKFLVQATFREPFEHFFEIAVYAGRFEHPRDANRLAERVRAAFKAIGLSKSLLFAFTRPDLWDYRSSAYDGLYKAKVEYFDIPASDRAIEADRKAM